MKIELEKELDANEIWELLTPDNFNELKGMFYDEFKEDYKEWLVGEGEMEEVE